MHSLEGIRDLLAQAVEEEVRMDMGSAGMRP
jgi:hypothetical protein